MSVRVSTQTITTTGFKVVLPINPSELRIYNEGANEVRIYFREEDFTSGNDYVSIPASTGSFIGPVNQPLIWLRAITSSSSVRIVIFSERT